MVWFAQNSTSGSGTTMAASIRSACTMSRMQRA
jgi:hypothetical protein